MAVAGGYARFGCKVRSIPTFAGISTKCAVHYYTDVTFLSRLTLLLLLIFTGGAAELRVLHIVNRLFFLYVSA